ncbi:hypothetical protein [Actinacidiphila glaucinigra]|uniref:hypothetical protein n=1 Tax=Actinacidiphila glaucinigra TaxID=235986 RepID=UPI003671FD74
MSTRRWIIAAWAGLCLVGIAATSALNAGSYPDKPRSPTEEPTAAHPVDCEALADDIAQARAEAERESHDGNFRATSVLVLEECADELEERGLKTR